MATAIRELTAPRVGTFTDVTLPELYAEDRWQEPFRALRAQGPIARCEESKFGPYWSVVQHQAIIDIEAKPEIFSSSWELGGITVAGDAELVEEAEVRMPMFIAMDPPKHTAQRKTVAPAFTPSEIERMRIDVRERTAAVLDSLPIGTPFDWVHDVSIELTTGMLAKLFDFPWEERHHLTRWSDILGDVEMFASVDQRQFRLQNAFEMGAAFQQLWQRKASEEPGKDLISIMLNSDAMSHMDEGEFMGNLILLIVGGNDTTRNSMSALVYGLDQFPDERAKLEANPTLAVNATQELIRWQTPLAHMRRTALQDVEMFGQMIRKGDRMVMWYLSGNRDEQMFENADDIRLDRDNARRHLSFGYGIHRCVGARVAELQLMVLMEEMNKRRLRAHVVSEPERVAGCFVHGYKKMMVELTRY